MKTVRFLFALALAVAMSLSMAGCGGDDSSDGGTSGGGNNNPGGNTNTTMTESEKKEFIDKTGRELVDKINTDDFKPITDLGKYVREDLTRSTNRSSKTQAIEDYIDLAISACLVKQNPEILIRLFTMTAFSREFSFLDGMWEEIGRPINTLRFNFPDKNGQPCVAEAVGSGREVEVHASIFDDSHKVYNNEDYTYYTQKEENRFKVPEQVNVKLTQGNSVLANIQVNINVNTTDGEFKYNANNISVTMNANIVGYHIVLSRAYYNGGSNAGVDVSVSKNNEVLLKANVTGNVRFDEDGKFLSAGNGNVYVDILGKVQVKGTLDDFNKVRDLKEKINRESTEEEVKTVADQMNTQFNIGVYFNNGSTRQAFLKAYPFHEKKSYYERWDIEPVVCFDDGTSYSTFAALGDDTRFKELIKKVENLITEFEDLVK